GERHRDREGPERRGVGDVAEHEVPAREELDRTVRSQEADVEIGRPRESGVDDGAAGAERLPEGERRLVDAGREAQGGLRGPPRVTLRVVADPAREDLLQPRELPGARLPRAVETTGDRRLDGLEPALEPLLVERTTGDRARRPVDLEPLRA